MGTAQTKTRAAALCWLVLAFLVSVASAQRSCAGACVTIRNCQPLLNLISEIRKGTASSDSVSRLKSSVCGFQGSVPLVCCRNTSPAFPSTAPVIQPSTTTNSVTRSGSCGLSGFVDKIVGGEDAPIGAWPWMAVLAGRTQSGQRLYFCGGVLIDARFVLTAAHCFLPQFGITLEYVRLGEHTLNQSPDCDEFGRCAPLQQDIKAQIISHPQYGKPCRHCNDIALLRLERPATIDPLYVSPICLPINFDTDNISGKFGRAAGWGSTSREFLVNRQSDVLQQVLLEFQELQYCRDRKQEYPDGRMVICAGGNSGRDTCRGDSGGPIMLSNDFGSKFYVVGITSRGPNACGSDGGQGIYTNVKYYLNWILATIRSRK